MRPLLCIQRDTVLFYLCCSPDHLSKDGGRIYFTRSKYLIVNNSLSTTRIYLQNLWLCFSK